MYLISCLWREYPAEKYIISQKYRNLISSFRAGDTLKFQDGKGNLSTFLIQKIDSTLHDKRGYFINAKEYKDISITCHELANARPGFEDYHLLTIVKDPTMDSTGFDLRLKNFYGIDTTYPFVLHKDTAIANNLRFTDYYFFRARNYFEQKDPNSVTQIYMTNQDGIVAYRCLDGVWWTKSK
jgi:hypothetical protein